MLNGHLVLVLWLMMLVTDVPGGVSHRVLVYDADLSAARLEVS